MLTIAGFDPSSGAGITADLATMAAHGYFGISAITALTVQSTQGVASSHPVDAVVLARTLDHLTADISPVGIKIGMLATAANVRVVCTFLRRMRETHPRIPVVLDPVLHSSSGRELLEPQGVEVLGSDLLPLVDWITPNVAELAVLAAGEVEEASQAMGQRFPKLNVVVTGGDKDARDFVRLTGGHTEWLQGDRISSASTHGTGCAFSSALLCRLADGENAQIALAAAKRYVEQAILRAPGIGSGHGPMNLLWPLKAV